MSYEEISHRFHQSIKIMQKYDLSTLEIYQRRKERSMNKLMNENLVYELINCCSRSSSFSLLLFVSA